MGLFGRRSAKEPTGAENFANCNMKKVQSKNYDFGNNEVALLCPRSEEGATEVSARGSKAAHRKLAKVAGKLLCGNCPFGSLDRVAGEQLLIAEIDISLARIAKQKELANARAEYDELQRTIAERVEGALGAVATGTPESPRLSQPPADGGPAATPPAN